MRDEKEHKRKLKMLLLRKLIEYKEEFGNIDSYTIELCVRYVDKKRKL